MTSSQIKLVHIVVEHVLLVLFLVASKYVEFMIVNEGCMSCSERRYLIDELLSFIRFNYLVHRYMLGDEKMLIT